MAQWHRQDPQPAPLREFREEDWPARRGECLGSYSCRAGGYGEDCRPLAGEPCGERAYQLLRDEYPAEAEVMVAAWKAADARYRFHAARLAWLGEDHPGWLAEFIAGHHEAEGLRYSYVAADGAA